MVSHKGGDTMAADGSVVIQITGDDKEFKTSLGSLGDIATAALKGVATAVAAASTAVAGLAVGAAKVGSEFETSLAATSTMFGDVAVDTDGLTSQILALSNATGVAATDLTSSLYNALSAGIPVTEDMTGAMDFMESSTKLAAAGFTDVDTAVTATAKVMNAYGMSLDDVDSIQKVMLQTQNKGITTVDELGATLAQVTPTAAAMGVSFENVGAALATMTAQGTPTAQATTQLNSLIAELGKSGTIAANNLAAAAEGTKYAGMSFTDMMDAGVPLNEVLDLMSDYADESGLSMIDLFSSLEGGKAALAMAGDNSAKFADNLAAMSTEADVVGDAYTKVTDTLEHRVGVLKESVTNLGIAVYDGMAEPLKEAAGMATDWVGQITDAFSSGGLEGAVGALGNVMAEAVTYVAGLAPKMIDAGINLLQSLLTGIQQNLPALAEGAVGIVTSLVNGILTLLPQLSTTAVQLLVALANGIAAALPTLIPAAVEAIATLVQGLVDSIPVLIDAALQLITGLMEGLIAAIPVLLEAIPTIIQSLVTALVENIPTIIQTGVDLLTALIDNLPEIIATIVAALPQIIDGITVALIGNIDKIIIAGVELLVALIKNLPEIIATIITAVPEIVSSIVGAFSGLGGEIVDIGVDIIKGVWDGISSMASWIGEKVTGFFGGVVDGVKNFLGIHSPSTVFADIGDNTIAGYAEGVANGAKANQDALLDTVSGLSSDMTDALGNGGGDAGTQLMNKLTTSASSALADVKTVASNSVTAFSDTVTGELPKVQTAAEAVMSTLCDTVTAKQPDVVNVATITVASMCDTILSKHNEFYRVGVDAMDGFNEGLEIQGQKAIATAQMIAAQIIATMQAALDIHSPSRKMRDLVGVPTAQGFFVGFEEEMAGMSKKMQSAVDAETNKIGFNAATQAESKAASSGVTREVYKSTNTVEKVAHIEGDGVTGELVRMLGLKLKDEDTRVGDNFED